ncbi:ABC transporter ATP-binding protein [Candidatus Formimonas warabiya]|uniref:Multidrug ABC transporter ATP-binding protein n=1 Tax=Formimonas warabiya TaxID=1761012 RepID=A0A3G1KX45_FORW1|nr:ABC transporter ATP-binding protein [Candidatus Formimonas warabiya]ATW26939.1 multidrug ABC transporter ATP-binding protein [Candidatus Formimonas warabiya]
MLGIIRKFFAFAGKRRGKLQQGIVFAFINSIFQALQIMALYVVLNALVENQVSAATAWSSFGIMLASMIGCILTKHKSTMGEAEGSFYMCADKRTEIGDRMKYMPMGYFNDNSLGAITATVTSTMEDVQDVAPRVMDKTIHGYIHAAVITLMLVFFDWRIGLIVVGGILLFIGVNALMQRKSRHISPARVAAQTALVGAVLEYVQGMSVVRAFNLADNAHKTMDRAIEECEKQNVGLEIAFIPFIFFQSLILKWVSVVLVIASIWFYLAGTMTLSVCLLMLISSFIIYSQLETAGSMSALLRLIDLSMDRVEEIRRTPVMDEKGHDISPADCTIVGSDVSFSYGERKIIDNVSFVIPHGTTTAVIGPSGGGKTTLCNLIARFWDADGGRITLGGRDVRDYSLDSLLSNFSMVFQNVYLFNDTIANNIKFGKPDATIEEIRAAARKACCDDFIMALPKGYDTVVGESGATISGGEKQRISIARAILKDAPVIILDEATANVDPENENHLQAAIAELTRRKTVIMIAHRLKTVRHADQILVLDRGKIIQRGKHDQLMAEGGLYADFIGMREKSLGWKLDGTVRAAG